MTEIISDHNDEKKEVLDKINKKELSVAEKKKEVLDKINEVVETFQIMRNDLLSIIEMNKTPDVTDDTTKWTKIHSLADSIKTLIEKNSNKTDTEIHTIHSRITQTIESTIQWIINETKLRTIITISAKLQDFINALGKNIKTWVWIEILALSVPKFTKIEAPLNLDQIKGEILDQINNINHRINDITNVHKVIEYLDVENSPVLDELIEYILSWKNYSDIEESMKKHWIIIEEIEIKWIKWEETIEPPKNTLNTDETTKIKSQKTNWNLLIEIFKEWYRTDMSVGIITAIKNVLKRRKEVN